MSPDQHFARAVIGMAAFAAMLLAVYHYGAGAARPAPLPAHPWTHSVAFKLRQADAGRGS